jgi:hypothetical protein
MRHGNNKYHKINMKNISSTMKNSMIQTIKLILERNYCSHAPLTLTLKLQTLEISEDIWK